MFVSYRTALSFSRSAGSHEIINMGNTKRTYLVFPVRLAHLGQQFTSILCRLPNPFTMLAHRYTYSSDSDQRTTCPACANTCTLEDLKAVDRNNVLYVIDTIKKRSEIPIIKNTESWDPDIKFKLNFIPHYRSGQ